MIHIGTRLGQVTWERTTRTDADRIGRSIRIGLISIMSHYPSQHNDGCTLLGLETVDPNVIRLSGSGLSRGRQLVSAQITCQCRVSNAAVLSAPSICAGQSPVVARATVGTGRLVTRWLAQEHPLLRKEHVS